MAIEIIMMRDEAELVVTLLEDNYNSGKYPVHAGQGFDLAGQIRELLGMPEYNGKEQK